LQGVGGPFDWTKHHSTDDLRFVCTTNKGDREIIALTSYPSERWPSDVRNKTRIWEAGRATAAATSFFDPIQISTDKGGNVNLGYVDGATGANNPVLRMWSEATDYFCESTNTRLEDKLKCLVSVGTGAPDVKAFGDTLAEVGETLLAIATETENTAEMFLRNYRHLGTSKKYFRFNVMKGLEKVGLEESSKMDLIKVRTDTYLAGQKVVQEVKECCEVLRTRECMVDFS
jgi:predicted acylesterase/phospholipase RssA